MTPSTGKNGAYSRFKRLTRPFRIACWAGLFGLTFSVLGFLAAPPLAKMVLERKLPILLHRPVSIGKISFNPFTLAVAVENFHLGQKDGPGDLVAFDRLFVNLEAASLFKRALIIQAVSLTEPRVEFSRIGDQTYNFSDLLGEDPAKKGAPPEQAEPFKFAIRNIEIKGGRVIFHDLPKKTDHSVTALKLGVPALSNLPYQVETSVQPEFSAIINGTPFALGGQSKPFAKSLKTEVELKATGINIPEYLAYIPNPTGLLLQSARLDVDAKLHLLARPDNTYRLAVIGRVALRNLAITDKAGQAYLQIPELAVILADSDLLAKEVHLSEINLTSPVVNLERLADGRLLPVALLTPADSQPQGPAAAISTDNYEKSGQAAGPSLKLAIDKLVLNNGRVDFLDSAVGGTSGGKITPARLALSELAIQVAALSNSPQALANLSLSGNLNQAGKIKVAGQLGLEPVQTRLHLQLSDLALKPFQSYISEQARLVIAGGKLTVTGALSLTPKIGGALQSDFQGEAAIANLATVDTVLGKDLLKWRNLGVKKIHFASDPGQLSIAAINLVDPYVNVRFGQDGVMNLTTIRPEKAAAATPPAQEVAPPAPVAEAAKPFATKIGSFSISGGRLDFLDRQVEPAYGTSLSELRGSVSDLSSLEESSAEVLFAGKLDQQAPLKITGRINPLRKDLFVDLKVDFTDINLSPMSPYGGKYIGYKIDKGKLNLDLKYDIANRKLNSQNKVFLDQFTLGQTVDSPDAANLPVRLALALLRDRQGGINLDLPVEGSLDDPSFRIGKVVLQVLINLISKAATSPIALLGALIPEGQDIQFIAFEPGRAEITPETTAKVATVEKILFERPELRMELIGKVDPTADSTALARQHLTNRVKLQKLLAGGKVGKDAEAQVEGVELSEAEYPALLTLAYQAALPKVAPERKPTVGAPPDLAVMESYLLGGIKVGQDDLRLLALARANQLLSTLVAGGKVEPGRLFVVEPKVGAAGDAAGTSQVELVIK